MVNLYHITTKDNAKSILKNGFKNGRNCFTKIRFLKYWWNKLEKESNKKLVALKITIPFDLYCKFYDWDLDEYSSGAPGEMTFDEPLKCEVELLNYTSNEL